ncbi:phosphoribosylanthranilate isomerase [Marivita sp. S0852]|uniref:phosphoribosylanthranilate isomerase n=1 Tax=Marivita sp. S0852 TaxID=3373893 RepID=UPI003982CA29
MSLGIRTKICGLTRPEDVTAVAQAGAAYCGFVFFPKSPRNLSIGDARDLAIDVPVGIAKVALVVNADDAFLDAITDAVPLDMLQLHGSESPDRVSEVRARYGLPVMKAVGVADADDVASLDLYAKVADQLLVDAKPPKNATLPGGNGISFDWRLISARRWSVPWMLAGGLTPDTVGEAIALTNAKQVDVSSGVESAPGIKDADLIARFVAATNVPRVA